MGNVAFDTLKFSRRLQKAGMESIYAEALAEAQRDALNEALDGQVATKDDIHGLRGEIHATKTELKDEIHATKTELKQDITKLDKKIDTVANQLNIVDTRLTGKINLLHWMLASNLVFTLAMFWKMFIA